MFNWNDFINGSGDLFKDDPWKISVEELVRRNSQEEIFIHPTSVVEEGAILKGPIYIGPNCFIGAHAYLRGGVYLMGNNSVGPGCELKTCILFPNTNLAHFNFVGDSILGSNVNMEAGAVIANHYNERTDKEIFPGVTKFGALIGDSCKIGANAVLSPGTILAKNTVVTRQELVNQQSMNKSKGFHWRDLFLNKAFDLVMVILGITIAFQLENWRTNSNQESLEKFYKESLLVDISADIEEMNAILAELAFDKRAVENYLQRMDQLPADSLMRPLQAVMTFETFGGHRSTYETLAAIGLNTFDDRQIVGRLTEYYSSYTSIRRLESVYTTAIFEINRHFSNYVVYDKGIVTKSIISMPATRNLLILAEGQLNSGIEDYHDALDKAVALKEALEKSL